MLDWITPTQDTAGSDHRKPTRRIGPGRRSLTGRISVCGHSVAFESTLERDLLIILAFDRSVSAVHGQPVRVGWRDGNGRTRRYTPDFVVEHAAAPSMLCEVKYRADFWADWPAAKPRYRAARQHARENGMTFSILTEVEIRGPYLDNVAFLRGYLGRLPDEGREETLVHALAALGEATPHALLLAAYRSEENRMRALGPLWRLIATRQVEADLSVPLTMQSAIWVGAGEDAP